jgi:hypothetical protein
MSEHEKTAHADRIFAESIQNPVYSRPGKPVPVLRTAFLPI